MADDFVQTLKLNVDDSEVSKAFSAIEKRAGNLQIKLKFDGPASKFVSQIQGNGIKAFDNKGAFSMLTREQRHAAQSASAFSIALESATKSIRLFSTRLSGSSTKAPRVANSASEPVQGQANLRLPFGRVGNMALLLPGFTQMAHMAYYPLKNFTKDSLTAFNVQNRAVNALKFGMQQNGTEERINELLKHSSEIQKKSIYGDETLLTAAAAWQPKIKDVDNSKKMLDMLSDYAAKVTGGGEVSAEQMKGFAQQLITALSGRSTALKYQGFDTTALEQLQKLKTSGAKVTEAMEIAALEKVLAPVRGMAQDLAKTDEGKIIQLKNAMGDLKESLGEKLQPAFARIVKSINSNMPSIEKGFNSFGNLTVKIVDTFSRNIDKLSAFADYGLKALNVISDYPAAFVAFGTAAKAAKITLGDNTQGLISSFNTFGGNLNKLATSAAWGLLASEIALLLDTLYKAYDQARTQKKKNQDERTRGNVRASLSRSRARYNKGEISEAKYKEVYESALKFDPTIAESERFNIWMNRQKNQELQKQKNVVVNVKTTNIMNNEMKIDSEMTARIIKDKLREFATSQLNFQTKTAIAKSINL